MLEFLFKSGMTCPSNGNNKENDSAKFHNLRDLNERLALYINKVRSLEIEKNFLESVTLEKQEAESSVITSYKQELEAKKTLLETLTKENAKIQIEVEKLQMNLKEESERSAKCERILEKTLKNLDDCLSARQALEEQNHLLTQENNKLHCKNQELIERLGEATKHLEASKAALGEKTSEVAHLSSQLNSLKKDTEHKKQVKRTEEIHRRHFELTKYLRGAKSGVEGQPFSLESLKKEWDAMLEKNRAAIEEMFLLRVKQLQDQLEKAKGDSGNAKNELASYTAKLDNLSTLLTQLENQKALLEKRVKELQDLIVIERKQGEATLETKQKQLTTLLERLQKCADATLLQASSKLDLQSEIAVYCKLLDSEEGRLRDVKRKHFENGQPSRKKTKVVTFSEENFPRKVETPLRILNSSEEPKESSPEDSSHEPMKISEKSLASSSTLIGGDVLMEAQNSGPQSDSDFSSIGMLVLHHALKKGGSTSTPTEVGAKVFTGAKAVPEEISPILNVSEDCSSSVEASPQENIPKCGDATTAAKMNPQPVKDSTPKKKLSPRKIAKQKLFQNQK